MKSVAERLKGLKLRFKFINYQLEKFLARGVKKERLFCVGELVSKGRSSDRALPVDAVLEKIQDEIQAAEEHLARLKEFRQRKWELRDVFVERRRLWQEINGLLAVQRGIKQEISELKKQITSCREKDAQLVNRLVVLQKMNQFEDRGHRELAKVKRELEQLRRQGWLLERSYSEARAKLRKVNGELTALFELLNALPKPPPKPYRQTHLQGRTRSTVNHQLIISKKYQKYQEYKLPKRTVKDSCAYLEYCHGQVLEGSDTTRTHHKLVASNGSSWREERERENRPERRASAG